MRIAVCDDCQEDALSMKEYLNSHEVRIFSDARQLVAELEAGNASYDLYLLDIYIDDSMNGIELARQIQSMEEAAFICFVSYSEDFYREAYDLYALQYLLKPVKEETLNQLVDKVSRSFRRHKEQCLSFQSRGQTGSIPYGKILYISSREHSIYIYCTDGSVQECKGKLSELALRLCGDVFMRCHQSFLVNMYHVDNLNGNDLMVAGHPIPVSRRYYTQVKQRYMDILFAEVD